MLGPKQCSSLKNINDYDIKEFTARDETRLFSFPKKDMTVYDCINNTTKNITPGNYEFDKWGKFHEK